MSRPMANLLLLLAGAIWGMGFVAQSTAMDAIGPFLFIGLRFLVASFVVAPLAIREMRSATAPLSRSSRRGFVAIGATLFAGMGLQQVGLLSTSVTNSGFLTGLYVIFTPVISLLVLRLRPHVLVWPAVLTTFAGIWLLAGGQAEPLNHGDYLTIACAVLWAVQLILIGRFASQSNRPYALSLSQFAITACLGLAVASVSEPLDPAAIAAALPEILFAGVFASGIAFTLQVVAQRYTSAPQAAIFLSTESLFAALFAALVLGETILPLGYLGGLLIFLAILLVEVGPTLMRRKPSVPGIEPHDRPA
ncbi:threonine/homoserine efflux transporter RhtA [Hoeflea marina]|uniref:Threonine/homoserine efflux transporter RhtA n=1 Tax=Hoeflea marina TaxID=274592 RepID=A0A317PFC2_9HYPH|nr:DMT family transporter [Hoeflea marina]PWV97632.1 threonine/homoserine efflux transporter RhtA [Hoeflea marina]